MWKDLESKIIRVEGLESKECHARKEVLVRVGLGVVIGFSLYFFLLPIFLGLVSLYKGSLEAEKPCHTTYIAEPLHKHKL